MTMAGNILVDGVLASCYAFPDHDVAHIGITPIRWFPQITRLIFGMEDGIHGYVNVLEHFGDLFFSRQQRLGRISI